jgi:hypothetical protein
MAALTTDEAVAFFYSGEQLSYTFDPTTPFVAGRWLGQLVLCTQIPFDDAGTYFNQHPVVLYRTYRPPIPGEAAGALIHFNLAGFSVRGSNMAVSLPIGDHVGLTIAYTDSAGDAAAKPGAIAWASTDPTIATVAIGADDATADVVAVKTGTVTISAVSGGITATLEVDVIAGVAAAGVITPGAPAPIGA